MLRRLFVTVLLLGLAGSTFAACSAPGNLCNGLVAQYPMNEASGTRADATGNGYDLTAITGNPGSVPGMQLDALALDSSVPQYVDTGSVTLPIGSGDFSIAFWVLLPDKTNTRTLVNISGGSGFNVSVSYNATLDRFRARQDSTLYARAVTANTFGSPSANTWHLIVYTYEKATKTERISIDGGAFDSASTSPITSADGWLRVGANQLGNGPATADVDELAIYDRLLDATDVADYYNNGSGFAFSF